MGKEIETDNVGAENLDHVRKIYSLTNIPKAESNIKRVKNGNGNDYSYKQRVSLSGIKKNARKIECNIKNIKS